MAKVRSNAASSLANSLLRANYPLRLLQTPSLRPTQPDEWYPGSALFMNDEVDDLGAELLR